MQLRSFQRIKANKIDNKTVDSNKKLSHKSGNMADTKLILDRMDKMKNEIIATREIKDREIMDRIDEINTNLTATVVSNTERIGELETAKDGMAADIATLFTEVNKVKERNAELSHKLVLSVAHSRRLNLHFLGHDEQKDEDVVAKVKIFLINTLKLNEALVNSMLVRDAHRLGVYTAGAKYSRPIIVGFVKMEDRNLISKNAFKCKNTKFAIRNDLPPELVLVRNKHLDIKKEIKKVNPEALVSITTRSYLPVILVKFEDKVQQFIPDEMDFRLLQPGDRRD
jgi:hypothetical protein